LNWIRASLFAIGLIFSSLVGPVARDLPAQVPSTVTVSDTIWEVELADGSAVIGRVTVVTAERVTLRTLGGATLEVERPLIRSMVAASGTVREGQLWRADPNRTRLFFGPTGRMLGQGEGYIGVFELFLPFVSYALADFFTVAGGTPIVPEAIGRVWYFAPKAGAQLTERTSLAAGVLAFVETSEDIADDLGTFGVLYMAATQGGEDLAGTVGVGFGFGDDISQQPVFLAGGEWRVSPRIKLLTENYFITHQGTDFEGDDSVEVATFFSAGLRLIGERLSADAGVALLLDENDSICCVPLVNFVYTF
jgi:hypothetical protein